MQVVLSICGSPRGRYSGGTGHLMPLRPLQHCSLTKLTKLHWDRLLLTACACGPPCRQHADPPAASMRTPLPPACRPSCHQHATPPATSCHSSHTVKKPACAWRQLPSRAWSPAGVGPVAAPSNCGESLKCGPCTPLGKIHFTSGGWRSSGPPGGNQHGSWQAHSSGTAHLKIYLEKWPLTRCAGGRPSRPTPLFTPP